MNTTEYPFWLSLSPSMEHRGFPADMPSRHGARDVRASLFPSRGRQWRSERAGSVSWSVFFLGLLLILAGAGGGFLHIQQITTTATSGYDLSALERKVEELRMNETRLELETAELQSLRRIEERLPKLNLVPSDVLAYTTPVVSGRVTGQVLLGTARD